MSKPAALLQGTLDLLILKLLDLKPQTGWEISKRLRDMSDETLQARHGSLYPALHKLEHEGWIQGDWKQGDSGRPSKVYSLTRAGQRQLAVERAKWTRLSAAVNSILEAV